MSLHQLALSSIGLGILCFLVMIVILVLKPQPMKIMNVVWPLTMLYSGPLGLLAYGIIGRNKGGHPMLHEMKPGMKMPAMNKMHNMPEHEHIVMLREKPSFIAAGHSVHF